MDKVILFDHLFRRDRVVFGFSLRPPLPGHLLAAVDQRVQVDLAGRVDVELGGLAVLKKVCKVVIDNLNKIVFTEESF